VAIFFDATTMEDVGVILDGMHLGSVRVEVVFQLDLVQTEVHCPVV
jgi:hypothetical protein